VCNLDLIIAADVMIAHLAGALNLPAWVLVDVNPHYSWGAPLMAKRLLGIPARESTASKSFVTGQVFLTRSEEI
jgi:hypothetical protein